MSSGVRHALLGLLGSLTLSGCSDDKKPVDAGSTANLPLVPLVSRHLSRYAFKAISSGQQTTNTCDAPAAEVLELATVEGHSGFMYRTPCDPTPFLVEGSGDQLTAYEVANDSVVSSIEYIHSPVEDGETWMTGGTSFEWRRIAESLGVPAGTFENCWERDGADQSLVYCRGVGLVRLTSTADNYVLELTEKNF
jgi:hypothetical protein